MNAKWLGLEKEARMVRNQFFIKIRGIEAKMGAGLHGVFTAFVNQVRKMFSGREVFGVAMDEV